MAGSKTDFLCTLIVQDKNNNKVLIIYIGATGNGNVESKEKERIRKHITKLLDQKQSVSWLWRTTLMLKVYLYIMKTIL